MVKAHRNLGKSGKKLNVKSTSKFIPAFRLCIEVGTSAWFFGFNLSLRKNALSPDVGWFVSFIAAKPKSEKGMMSSEEDVLLLGCVVSICCILALVSSLDPSVS